MGRRLRAVNRGLQSGWGLLTMLMLMATVIIVVVSYNVALHSKEAQLTDLRSEIKCRSEAAAQLDTAINARGDALADSEEAVLRLFDASFKRDQASIEAEGRKLPELFGRIHETSADVAAANQTRVASIDACAKG